MADQENVIDPETGTDIEIADALRSLRVRRVGRIQQADREIPTLYASIKAAEDRIEAYRQDRVWCVASLRTLDRHLAALKE